MKEDYEKRLQLLEESKDAEREELRVRLETRIRELEETLRREREAL